MDADPVRAVGRDRLATIDLSVYGLDAVLKSAYRFTGRCFVHLQRGGDGAVELRMRPKRAEEDADAAIRDFLNDLLEQRVRSTVAAETAGTRDLIMAHALSRTALIRPELETAEPTEDPQNASSPTDPERLRLEPPFYSAGALAAAGLDETPIEACRFADDSTAAALNAALRTSIEAAWANGSNPP